MRVGGYKAPVYASSHSTMLTVGRRAVICETVTAVVGLFTTGGMEPVTSTTRYDGQLPSATLEMHEATVAFIGNRHSGSGTFISGDKIISFPSGAWRRRHWHRLS